MDITSALAGAIQALDNIENSDRYGDDDADAAAYCRNEAYFALHRIELLIGEGNVAELRKRLVSAPPTFADKGVNSKMYEIEKDIPIPPPKVRSSGTSKYPWDKMEIGDSFFAPVTTKTMLANTFIARRRRGHNYNVRGDGNGGCRVWRIK